jgi:Inorganic pyrophosphatase
MTNYFKLPTWADSEHVYAVVETPRGGRAKLEFDPKLGAFTLAKPLLAGLTYPYDWGFIPSTKAEDGDPLDVLIIHDAATYPGLVLACKPIGVLEVVQSSKGKQERNDRVFVVPDRSLRGRSAGHSTAAAKGNQGTGEILRSNRRARTEDTEIPGMARPGQGHQDDQEVVALNRQACRKRQGPAFPGQASRAIAIAARRSTLVAPSRHRASPDPLRLRASSGPSIFQEPNVLSAV